MDGIESGNTSEAIKVCLREIRYAESLGDFVRLGQALNALAVALLGQGKAWLSLSHFNRALEVSSYANIGGQPLAAIYNNIAQAYNFLGEFDLAEQHYKAALGILESVHPYSEFTAIVIDNLAAIHLAREEYDQARELTKKSLAILEEAAPKSLHHAIALTNLAVIDLNHPELATERLKTAEEVLKKIAPQSPAMVKVLTELGRQAWKGFIRSPREACEHFASAIEIAESLVLKSGSSVESRLGSLSSYFAPYDEMISALWIRGLLQYGFNYSERCKARTLSGSHEKVMLGASN